MRLLLLTEDVKELIEKDAKDTYPHECCGFLYGKDEEAHRIVTKAEVVDNTRNENRERRFEISPQDYMKAEKYADEHNLTLLGVYHSHPNHPAVPSEYDRTHAFPYFSYIITSVKRGEIDIISSWVLGEDGKFEEEDVKLSTADGLKDLNNQKSL